MKQKWVLFDTKTSLYVKNTTSGISFTSDIEEAKVYSRKCDVSNSIAYWNSGWRYYRDKKSYNIVSKEVEITIALID